MSTDVRLFEEATVNGFRDYYDVISLINGSPTTLMETFRAAVLGRPYTGILTALAILAMRAHALEGRGRILLLTNSQPQAPTFNGANLQFSYFDDYGVMTTTGGQVAPDNAAGSLPPDPSQLNRGGDIFGREQRATVPSDTQPFSWPEFVVQPGDATPPADQPYLGLNPPGGSAPTTYLFDAHELRGRTRLLLIKSLVIVP